MNITNSVQNKIKQIKTLLILSLHFAGVKNCRVMRKNVNVKYVSIQKPKYGTYILTDTERKEK